MSEIKDKFLAKFQLFEQSINGKSTSSLHQSRRLAIDDFSKQGFPTRKNEEWKYTSIEDIISNDYQIDQKNLVSPQPNSFLIPELQSFQIVLVNGVFSESLSSISELPKGLIIENLKSVLYAEKLASLSIGNYRKYNADGFIQLSDAFVENGVFIEVSDNQTIEKPIAIYNITSENNFAQPKTIIKVGKNASIQIIETYSSNSIEPTIVNTTTEIFQQADSLVKYYKIQNCISGESHVGTTQVNQIGKSVFNGVTLTFGGKVIRNNFNITFSAPFSETHLHGLALIQGETHVDNHTVVDHAVPNCESTELYKNIVDGSASAVFNGKIFVRKDAQKTNAYQSSKNILLSKEANAFSKPQLEIWADDVKCSHGSTTGQLDKEALFYLRARGIGEKQAKALLTKAYVNDILDKIEIPALRNQLEKLIETRFDS